MIKGVCFGGLNHGHQNRVDLCAFRHTAEQKVLAPHDATFHVALGCVITAVDGEYCRMAFKYGR